MFQAGDIFTVRGTNLWLSKPIEIIQKYVTPTCTGNETHAGVFTDSRTVFESQWKVECNNFYNNYGGREVIVGRLKDMTPELWEKGFEAIKPYEGKLYPITRLFMFLLFPHISKYITPAKILAPFGFSNMVCSELAVFPAHRMGFKIFKYFRALMPAHLSTRMLHYKEFEIILNREICPKEEPK